MKTKPQPLKCYIAGYQRPLVDQRLRRLGISDGMVVFAIPSLGIQMRCRAKGTRLDLEYAAFFSALKFIRDELSEEKLKAVSVLTSTPELLWAVAHSDRLDPTDERRQLLDEYKRAFGLSISYLSPKDNLALCTTTDLPSLPEGVTVKLKSSPKKNNSPRIMPIQTGIEL
ncbi:MAG: hypothetical protein ACE5FH_05375 [Candidatus Zixiibacteriota bacterium]